MNSRRNLLNPRPLYLGCGVQFSTPGRFQLPATRHFASKVPR